jgi:hypothetical protein
MKIVATYDMTLNLGSGPEAVLRGQEIDPPGTGTMDRTERATSLIRQGAAVLTADWPEYRDATEKKRDAALSMVAEAQKETDRAVDARRRAADERAKAQAGGA